MSRFVSRLGFDNYASFQQALRDDLSARVLSPVEVYRSHVADSTTPRWVWPAPRWPTR